MATLLFTDNFTRSNTSTDSRPYNTVAVGNEWADVFGGMFHIASNAAVTSSTTYAPLLRPAYETPQNSRVEVVVNLGGAPTNGNFEIVSRYGPLRRSGYSVQYINGDLAIQKIGNTGAMSWGGASSHNYPPSAVDYVFAIWVKYVSATRTIVAATMAQASTPTTYEAVAILADDDFDPAQWATTPSQALCNGLLMNS